MNADPHARVSDPAEPGYVVVDDHSLFPAAALRNALRRAREVDAASNPSGSRRGRERAAQPVGTAPRIGREG
jgi:hypothetical protein